MLSSEPETCFTIQMAGVAQRSGVFGGFLLFITFMRCGTYGVWVGYAITFTSHIMIDDVYINSPKDVK